MSKAAQEFTKHQLDDFDFRILGLLLDDARIKHLELAESVGLSATACARRIRQREASGVLRGYKADLDPTALGLLITVIVTITLERQNEETLAKFEAAVGRCPNVISCHLMSGNQDYVLEVSTNGIEDFEQIHKQYLSRLPGIARIHSSFAMREIVRRSVPDTALRVRGARPRRKNRAVSTFVTST